MRGGTLLLLAALLAPTGARALDDEELPRDPESLDAVLGGQFHITLVYPMVDAQLCPAGAECVLGFGGGIGGTVERRWPGGLALGLGYDAWFLDSNGVFELGVMHELRGQIRQLFLPGKNIHPYAGVGAGGILFGDTLRVSTLGFAVDVLLGLEIEVTRNVLLTLGLPIRFFATPKFTTPRDRVPRAEQVGINSTIGLLMGFVVVESP